MQDYTQFPAKKNFEVYGYEIDNNTFNTISKGKAQFYEENINNDLKKTLKNKKIKLFQNLKNIGECNVIFITVGTPIKETKKVNLKKLFNLINNLKDKLEENTIVALRSTVKLGTTKKIKKIFNKNKKINLEMCPDTAEGSL